MNEWIFYFSKVICFYYQTYISLLIFYLYILIFFLYILFIYIELHRYHHSHTETHFSNHETPAKEPAPSYSCLLPDPLRLRLWSLHLRPIRSHLRWGPHLQGPALPPPPRGGGDLWADLRFSALHLHCARESLLNPGVRLSDVPRRDVSLHRQWASAWDPRPWNRRRPFPSHSRSSSWCYAYSR